MPAHRATIETSNMQKLDTHCKKYHNETNESVSQQYAWRNMLALTATAAALLKTSLIASFWLRASAPVFRSLFSRSFTSDSNTPGSESNFYREHTHTHTRNNSIRAHTDKYSCVHKAMKKRLTMVTIPTYSTQTLDINPITAGTI